MHRRLFEGRHLVSVRMRRLLLALMRLNFILCLLKLLVKWNNI